MKDSTVFEFSATKSPDSILWSFDLPINEDDFNFKDSIVKFVFSDSGTFNVSLISYYGNCSDTSFKDITIKATPYLDLGNDTSICIGETLLLDAESSGNTYLWQDGSTISSYIVNQQGTYSVEVNLNECVISDTIQITEDICSSTLEIPNVFTPDNDGVNDYFIPISTGEVSSMKTVIYNRWGRKVFETDNPMIEWSGESSSSGTYFWVVFYKEYDREEKALNGCLTLIS